MHELKEMTLKALVQPQMRGRSQVEAGQRLQVTFVGKGLRERLGASSEAQMRLKTMPLQVDSVLRY